MIEFEEIYKLYKEERRKIKPLRILRTDYFYKSPQYKKYKRIYLIKERYKKIMKLKEKLLSLEK
jgi:hypothetical protein